MIKQINPGSGNWKTIVFMMINELVSEGNPMFSRSILFNVENLDTAIKLSEVIGHKENSKAPEQTLQRTLQNMRDKGLVDFLGQGEYRLTNSGYDEMAKRVGDTRKAGELSFNKIRNSINKEK